MSDDTERLVVSLEARIRDFEKNFQKAERTGSRTYQQLQAGSSRATRVMEADMARSTSRINQALATTSTRIGTFGKAFAGGFVGSLTGLGLAGIVGGLGKVAQSVAEIGDQAKIAGVNIKAFQELKYVAEQNRIGVDALTDGLKELNLRADEFISTGQGSAAESFQRLGYDARTLAEKLKDPSALFTEIIGKLERLDKAAQIRISDELFGGSGGEQFVKLIAQGEAGIRDTIKAANDLGIVMDEQMIKKAEEVDRKFQTIVTTVGSALKGAIVDAASSLGTFIDMLNDVDKRSKSTIETQLQDKRDLLAKTERSDMAKFVVDGAHGEGIANLRKEIIDLENELKRRTTEGLRTRLLQQADQMRGLNIPKGGRLPATPTPGASSSTKAGDTDLRNYLAPGRGAAHVDGLASAFEAKLTKMIENLPDHLKGQVTINSGFRSVERQEQLWQQALEKYGSVEAARKWVAPPGNSQHNKGNAADLGYGSDQAKQWAHQNAGQFGLSFPLGNEDWHVEDADARKGAMADKTRDLEERGAAYDDIMAKAREFIAEQSLEGRALDMTKAAAARLRYEQELLNEAKSAGITLSPPQIDSLKALAAEMAAAEAQTVRLAERQQELKDAAAEFGAIGKSVAKGFVQDLMQGASAADALKGALTRLAESLADRLLDRVFDDMFAGLASMGGGGGGIGGWLANMFSGAFVPNGAQATWAAGGGIGMFAKGGISDRPAIFGEAGPEAAVPLPDGRRIPVQLDMRGGMGQPQQRAVNRQINVYNAPPGTTVVEEEDAHGNEKVNVTFSKIAASEARRPGSALNKTLRGMGAQAPRVRR
ncbi:D-alanyl-D-alanine carboxypeptidase family protein [Pararhizobium gei]|uniref:M15 family metallopeptidase n=1 Tax=Pararhizobium gei TaxID=1395951 RepID=UPI0023D99CC0|nr:D-alanyl-D-alanine carboxypeptidase family protein [Rhizobium gei]